MSKRTAVALATLALAGLAGGTAAAESRIDIGSINIWDAPIIKEYTESTHSCGGEIDYACKDGTGAFCTVWYQRCTVGE